jgi:NhaP-type Na+/H+ or K+/H+ antiporter
MLCRHSTDREVAIMILMAYLSYMLSMLLDLSGILTVFFSGIVMSHYTWHNVTESSRITTKYVLSDNQFYWQPLWFLLDENIYVYGFLIFFIHFTGTLLLLYLSLLKFFYFSMLGWMHWTLKNGN